MSELPRTEALPRSEEGYDPATSTRRASRRRSRRSPTASTSSSPSRTSCERSSQALRVPAARLRARACALRERGMAAWTGRTRTAAAPTPDWVSSVPAPLTRPIAIPRLVLEAIFLVLVALFAGLADLSTTAIVVVMAAPGLSSSSRNGRRPRGAPAGSSTPSRRRSTSPRPTRQHRAVEHPRRRGDRGRGARRLRVAHGRDEAAARARAAEVATPEPETVDARAGRARARRARAVETETASPTSRTRP